MLLEMFGKINFFVIEKDFIRHAGVSANRHRSYGFRVRNKKGQTMNITVKNIHLKNSKSCLTRYEPNPSKMQVDCLAGRYQRKFVKDMEFLH